MAEFPEDAVLAGDLEIVLRLFNDRLHAALVERGGVEPVLAADDEAADVVADGLAISPGLDLMQLPPGPIRVLHARFKEAITWCSRNRSTALRTGMAPAEIRSPTDVLRWTLANKIRGMRVLPPQLH